MNKDEGKKLIQDTLQNTFSKERFIFFVKNLLNDYDESKAFHAHGYVLEIYRNFVKTYERLGTYTDPIGKKIDIIIVYLQKETTIDKARTAQRNFIAQYLKDRGEKDAGLIAFVSPNLEDWRFSFVKMEYRFEETKDGKVKAKESFTPAKRYSFLVGPNEASHTAQSRMLPIILNDSINPTIDEIEDIFSVEKVTKEFFEQYKKLFLNLADEFTSNKEFENKVAKEHKIEVADFVKKLMGQIVFLYFLQKKGWLGVKPGERWGTGDKKFMHNLFDKKYCDYQNYFNDVLEPLFYDTLNKRDRGNSIVTNDQSYSSTFKCRIPYLNGGLFTPIYDWQETKIFIDNKYFHDIFEVFDTFNFTVFESDPIEKEVAVDPEMLGKVFENLLEVRDRKSKGAFYTPREIVHYMCQESLINYLISQSGFPEIRIRNLMKTKDQGIGRTEKQIELIENSPELKEIAIKVNNLLKIVKVCDPAVGSGAFPMGLLKEISTTRYFLNKHFLKENNKTGHLLTEYDIKKETLENCIYGVDIDPGAVEIARLRFWLSLVVEHDIEEIEPLPNLDYKIMQGNSLIELLSPNLLAKTDDDNRNKIINQLTISKTEYFNLSDTLSKSKKREEINLLVRHIVNYDKEKQRNTIWTKIKDIRSQIGLFKDQKVSEQLNIGDISSKEISKEFEQLNKIENVSNTEHFEWHLNFNEVFEKGGFDIVIANPPYIGEKGHKEIFEEIKQSALGINFYMGKMDLFYFFFHLGIDLSKKKGIITFITTNYYITATGGIKLRRDIRKRTSILNLINFGELKIFESALGQHNMITMLIRDITDIQAHTLITKKRGYLGLDAINSILSGEDKETDYYLVPQKDLYSGDNIKLTIGRVDNILDKIKSNIQLINICDINCGYFTSIDKITPKIKTTFFKNNSDISINNGVYVISNKEKELYLSDLNDFEKKRLLPSFKNSDINKYYCNINNSNWLIDLFYPGDRDLDIKKIPHIFTYISKFEKVLKSRKQINANGLNKGIKKGYWWMAAVRRRLNYSLPKIIAPQRSKENAFGYNEVPWYASSDVYYITNPRNGYKLKFLLGILNSKLIYVWLYKRGKRKGEMLELYQEPLSKIPIKIISEIEQKPFVEVVDKILLITKEEDYLSNQIKQNKVQEYQKQIDDMVYKLYGLTEEEIKIIEEKDKVGK